MRQSDTDISLHETALYRLVVQYARAVDRRDYAAFDEIFAADGRLAGYRGDPASSDPLFQYSGREEIMKGLQGIERFEKTFHLLGNVLFDIGEGEAQGETYCTAHHIYQKDGASWNRTMAIRYQDAFVRREGRWYLQDRALWIVFELDGPLGDEGWA